MGHRVHPKSYRLKNLNDWDSRWLTIKKTPQYLEEDFKIREIIKEKLSKVGVARIEIERFPGKITVIVSSARPGIIIGRGGSGIEDLKKEIEKKVFKSAVKEKIRIEIKEVKDPWASAVLSAQWVAQQIEKRIAFRRVLKQAIEKISISREVKGVRVELAGRLDGSEIARKEWLKKGRLPRQTIGADIDYARENAHCSYGLVGVKVWIYKGDKFE
ncbi:MAG: 30S ribosomal protein S3 [Candidatus Nealsonbacteria bacterium]|nr:30S ribosomal protein S3 [Candidatus Nealsonbacteria bacterium]